MWRERRLRFGPRVTLPLLFSSLFLFQSGSDRKDIRSSRRCGNVCKRPCLRSYGKRCLRAVGKPTAFPSGRECLFSIGGAAVFHISIALRASLFDKGLGPVSYTHLDVYKRQDEVCLMPMFYGKEYDICIRFTCSRN